MTSRALLFFLTAICLVGLGIPGLVCYVYALDMPGHSDRDEKAIFQADPTIFYHEGYYYLYGTNGDQDQQLGFKVYRSSDLIHWEGPVGANGGFALSEGEVFGTAGFWAPQVWYENGQFYMAYTANENIAIAMSDSPIGPFRQQKIEPLMRSGKQIDPFVYLDADGKKYLYHVRLINGNRIFVAELKDDYSGIKEETLRECLHAALPWENTEAVSWPVAEGPTVLRQGGKYYMFYSANDFRNPNYAVGLAMADHVYGPWTKIGTGPLLSERNSGWPGTGHGDVFRKDEQWYYVCHTHYSKSKVGPRRTAIVSFHFQEGEDRNSAAVFDGTRFRLLKAD